MMGTLFLNRYRIDRELGQGGMGMVYKAHDELLDRDVAIKILNRSALGTEGRVRMLREAQAAAQLNHPNIVSIYDAGESENIPFIVMELVDGDSLYEKRPAGLLEMLGIARQICLALDHAHSHNIVHRDLKPENVLVNILDQVKLTDFGLARSIASRITTEGSIAGSVLYLAPELALGQVFDGRADLYALGVILYELTAGEPPFTADDPLAIISQHLHAPVVPPRARNEHIPTGLDALIQQLMSKQPEDRPASALQVFQMLERIETGDAEPAAGEQLSLLDRMVRGRLVGRENELAVALNSWEQACAGQGGVLLISGEPGIGKTRLAYELVAQVQVRGARVVMGNCYAEGSAPYSPVAQIIEAVAGLYPLDQLPGLPGLLSLAPALRARYPEIPALASLEDQAEQKQMLENLVACFSAISDLGPVLLVLEDAHWADSCTLDLLLYLARRAARQHLRLMLLLTYREIELDEIRTLNQVLYDLEREHLSTRIKLGRLSLEQTEDLLKAILQETPPPDFLDSLQRETEGNPFFIEEVCKALIEQEELSLENGHWRWPHAGEIKIPQSIKMAIQSRLSRLPAIAQETLRIASVTGREFDFETLKAVCELPEEDLLEALESAERAQLILEIRKPGKSRGGSRAPVFAFQHALIASTLYESMNSLRRRRLHQRIALALERLNQGHLEGLEPQLGRHFAEAAEWDKASRYLLQAGDQARRVYAYPEAIDQYQQALTILKDQDNYEMAARTLMKLGLLYHATFDFQHSRQAYQEGFTLWRQASEALPDGSTSLGLKPAPHALRLGAFSPLTLDPSLAYENTSVPFIDQIFAGLVSLTPDLDVAPEIAERWEVLENGRKYIFYLHEDATWTDGAPVTAGDFEFAWKRILNPETHSRNHVLFYDIRAARDFYEGRILNPDEIGVHARDDYTLEVELEQPAGYFLHLLAYAAAFPVPRHIVGSIGSGWTDPQYIVTNGAFKLEAWEPCERMLLTRNPRYVGRFSGNVGRIEVLLKPELANFSQRLAAYEADLLDLCGFGGMAQEADRARQRHAGEYVTLPSANVSFLVFFIGGPPFGDARVRRAFVQSIDREALADLCLRGYAAPAMSGLVPAGLPGHLGEPGLPFAPERARQLLSEAGYPNGKGFPSINVWLITPESMNMFEAIHDQWLEHLGVESRWETMDSDCLYRRLETEQHPHIFFNGWLADYPDPDTFLRVGIAYQTRWHHPEYDRLVEQARRVTNQAERMKMYREAERILIQEAPVMPLIYGRSNLLVKPWVRRFPISPIKGLIAKDVIIEEH